MAYTARRVRDVHALVGLLRGGASATALCAALFAAPAFAQAAGGQSAAGTGQKTSTDQTESTPSDIVVTGIRASLANAQNIKRNSDTVVDAITAQDIGALPDRSVTEALQRVPGVAINRFAGSNDPDHFSAEGSGVTVRGLNFVRSEFNGRDTFSAGVGGQAINFADVPSELLGSVEIFKNATAENIEGGLAGTVNLNTRKPFDNKGFHIAFDAEANYGDFEKKWAPVGSLLVSNTWNTGIGQIGILADVAYSRLRTRADGIQVTNIQARDNTIAIASNSTAVQVCRNPLPGTTDTTTLPAAGTACGTASGAGADGYLDNGSLRYAPLGGQFRSQDFDRKRDGQALALQWESNDSRTALTAQFLRTHTTNSWGEHTFESAPDLSEYNTYPKGCLQNTDGPNGTTRAECPVGSTQNYTYDSTGLFQKGYITYPGGGWRGQGADGSGFVPAGGIQQSLSRRQVFEENTVSDYGANFRVQPADRFFISLDGDYTRAHHTQLDVSTFGSTFADQELDLTGNIPVLVPHKPLALAYSWGTPNPALVSETDAQYFSDPRVQFWRAAMDHIEDSVGREYSFKADFDRKFDEGFVRDIKFGARYADRNETIRYSTYNWGALSEVWGGSSPVSIAATDRSQSAFYSFPDFFRGATPGPVGGFYYTGDLIGNYQGASNFLKSVNQQWQALGGSAGWVPAAQRAGAIDGYLPNEIQTVSQANADVYVMANFRSDNIFGGTRMSGNIGLRYVHTEVRSAGTIFLTPGNLGVDQPYATRCAGGGTAPQGVPPGVIIGTPGGICLLGQTAYNQLQNFAGYQTVTVNGVQSVVPIPGAATATPNIANVSYDRWLPSLNLKFELSRNLIGRFAASRVMTLPDMASIRNSLSASYSSNDNTVTFNLGNPYLKPATATQFDVTLEWYFARVGSLTFDAFYKDVQNFFYANSVQRNFTQNGVTEPITVRIADNYSGHGKIKGFEVAYQQTFDFLPSFLSGLGMSASYTFIDSSGLPNSFLNTGSAASVRNVTSGNLPLEQLSKHTVNIAGFYEKGPISLRAAYNWRSRFLLTSADVIFPYAPIFNDATGSLDASAFVTIYKGIKLGVQGVNLTNTVTKTLQAYNGDPNQLAPRSYFVQDRRFSFIIRGSF